MILRRQMTHRRPVGAFDDEFVDEAGEFARQRKRVGGRRADDQRLRGVGDNFAVGAQANDGAAQRARPGEHEIGEQEAPLDLADRRRDRRIEGGKALLRLGEQRGFFVDGAERPDLRQKRRAAIGLRREFGDQRARRAPRRDVDREIGERERAGVAGDAGNDLARQQRAHEGREKGNARRDREEARARHGQAAGRA